MSETTITEQDKVTQRIIAAAQAVIDDGLTIRTRDELATALDAYWGTNQ